MEQHSEPREPVSLFGCFKLLVLVFRQFNEDALHRLFLLFVRLVVRGIAISTHEYGITGFCNGPIPCLLFDRYYS